MPKTAITILNPFPNEVRAEFNEYIHSDGFKNKERIEYADWHRMQVFLDNKNIIPNSQVDSRLRTKAFADFELHEDKKLYRQPDKSLKKKRPHIKPRYVVPESDAFDIIVNEHLKLLHVGQNKTWEAINDQYYGINRLEVIFVLQRCLNCAINRPSAIKAPLVPIISERPLERVQIDLIDMRHEPSGQFKWILHIKGHFSKYTQLYPLISKEAGPIADRFLQYIIAFLPPMAKGGAIAVSSS